MSKILTTEELVNKHLNLLKKYAGEQHIYINIDEDDSSPVYYRQNDVIGNGISQISLNNFKPYKTISYKTVLQGGRKAIHISSSADGNVTFFRTSDQPSQTNDINDLESAEQIYGLKFKIDKGLIKPEYICDLLQKLWKLHAFHILRSKNKQLKIRVLMLIANDLTPVLLLHNIHGLEPELQKEIVSGTNQLIESGTIDQEIEQTNIFDLFNQLKQETHMIRNNKLLQLEEIHMKKTINQSNCSEILEFIKHQFGMTPEEVADIVNLSESDIKDKKQEICKTLESMFFFSINGFQAEKFMNNRIKESLTDKVQKLLQRQLK